MTWFGDENGLKTIRFALRDTIREIETTSGYRGVMVPTRAEVKAHADALAETERRLKLAEQAVRRHPDGTFKVHGDDALRLDSAHGRLHEDVAEHRVFARGQNQAGERL